MTTKPHIVLLDAGSVGDDFSWPDFASLGQVTAFAFTKPAEVVERAKNADIVLTNKVYLRKEFIEALPKLKYVGTLATGFNQVAIETAAARGIPVCNVPSYSTPSVVHHVFALMFELASKISLHAQAVRNGEWGTSTQFCFWKEPLIELSGKTLGIVGFGDIGQAVARAGHAFGMNIIAYAPRPKPAPEYAPFSFVDVETLFRTADVVSMHCPSNDESRGMINARLLGTMKKNALFINCARGDLVHEQDLAAALAQGAIAGAGLDVVAHEPMKDDNPLRQAPNCVITPHVAWASVEARQRLMEGVFRNVQNYLAGTPTNVVNGVK